MSDYVLALDLGGTNSRFGAVSADGVIVARRREKTPEGTSGEELVDFLIEHLRSVTAEVGSDAKVIAIAAAIPAIFDAETGLPARLPNIPELEGVDLSKILNDAFGVRAFLENDATAATIGEHWLGASKGSSHVVGVTLGTGVGGGLIIEGKPFRGRDGNAGEIGHICVELDGIECPCGSRGCVEQYSSGTAIVRQAKDLGLNVKNANQVYDLAVSGNNKAVRVFESAGRHLGIALSGLVNVLNPEAIVLGGGVAASWDFLIEPVRREIASRCYEATARRIKICRAMLGEDAGILGAARTAFPSAKSA